MIEVMLRQFIFLVMYVVICVSSLFYNNADTGCLFLYCAVFAVMELMFITGELSEIAKRLSQDGK